MNVVKWMRVNNKKLMAVVVILIMLAFVMPQLLRRLARPGGSTGKTLARFGTGEKITTSALAQADMELMILKMLRADYLLQTIQVPQARMPDLKALMLSQLIFSEQQNSQYLMSTVKQIVQQGSLRVTQEQIDEIFAYSGNNPELFWLVLKAEAANAGYIVSPQQASRALADAIPSVTRNQYTATQLVEAIVNQRGIPEKKIFSTFADLLAILNYSKAVCSTESYTTAQIMNTVEQRERTLDAEILTFPAVLFADKVAEPAEEQLIAHFDKYKDFFNDVVTEGNPHGIGFKQRAQASLEYMAVSLDDVKKNITTPTDEEVENYYQRNISTYTKDVPVDPEDPDSPTMKEITPYAQIADFITEKLFLDKVGIKAKNILNEAMTLTMVSLDPEDDQEVSAERLITEAIDYKLIAEKLGEKYNVKVHTGKTGLLTAGEMFVDENLNSFYIESQNKQQRVRLSKIVFAVDELAESTLSPFETNRPRIYENIGPMTNVGDKHLALFRIAEVKPAFAPAGIDENYDKTAMVLDDTAAEDEETIYSVKEKVTESFKRLAAMPIAKARAEQFAKEVKPDEWENAIEQLNEEFPKEDDEKKAFALAPLADVKRTSSLTLRAFRLQTIGHPQATLQMESQKRQAELVALLFDFAEVKDKEEITMPHVFDFQSSLSWYVLKSLSVKPLYRQDYETTKSIAALSEDYILSQSLAAVHFNPKNILKRNNFVSENAKEEQEEPKEDD